MLWCAWQVHLDLKCTATATIPITRRSLNSTSVLRLPTPPLVTHPFAGVGAVDDGDLVVSLGTSGTLFCPSAKPIMDVEGLVAPFCDATGTVL